MGFYSFRKRTIVVVAATLVMNLSAEASDKNYFPIASSDQLTIEAQRLVEELYKSKQYKRSRIIYEKELAPIGDKYAQYMVGYMLINGQGSAVNRPAALAWYRLAAERGEPLFIQARDAFFQTMSQEEVALSNEIFLKLWRKMGDNRLILNLVHQDLETLKARTGSRLAGSRSSPIAVVNMRSGKLQSEASYLRIQKRVELRMKYLNSNIEIDDVDLTNEFAGKKSLEMEISNELAALGQR